MLDYLPAPQAFSMIVRSRSRNRASTCAKYALSRMDKMVSGLAAAEDAFHHVRRPVAVIGLRTGKVIMSLLGIVMQRN